MDTAHQVSLSFTISLSLLKLISIDLVMPSNHLILFCPLLPLSSIFPNIRDFSNGLILNIRWPNYWEFSFSISPFNEESELITFRIDCSDLWCWRRLLRVPWTARRSNQSILKETSPESSLKRLMLKLKVQYFGHLMRRADSFEKTLMLEKIEGRRRRG